MPTDALNFITDGASSVRMKWREPYVTEGINRKMAGVDPRGIYRGFRLNTDAAVLSVKVSADVVKTDHLAVYESTTGFSISLRRTGGDFTVNLAAYPATTVYLAIYVVYATLTTTQAVLRVYTAAEYAVAVEKPDLIVLGQVVVPGAGIIADTAIVAQDRIEPWNQEAPNVKQWHPIVSNANLAYADQTFSTSIVPNNSYDLTIPGANWYARASNDVTSVSNITMALQATDVPFVGAKAITLTAAGVGPNLVDFFFVNTLCLKVQPGDRIRLEWWYKVHQLPTANGTIGTTTSGADDAVPPVGANFKGGSLITITAAGGWIKASSVYEVTGTVKQSIVQAVGFAQDITFAAAGALISLGPWQCWLESSIDDGPENKIYGHQIPLGIAKFRDPRIDGARGWRSVPTDNEVWLMQQQSNTPSISVPQRIDLKPHEKAGADIWTQLRTGQVSAGELLSQKTNADEQEQARFQASYSNARKFTLLFEGVGADPQLRIYQRADSFDQGIAIVYGARWDDSAATWLVDGALTEASRLVMGDNWNGALGYSGWRFQTGQAPLTEAAWTDRGAFGYGPNAADQKATFGGQIRLGEQLAALGTDASEVVPRIRTISDTSVTTGGMTLVSEHVDAGAPTIPWRQYIRRSAIAVTQWITTRNARWDFTAGLWHQDDATEMSIAQTFGTLSSVNGTQRHRIKQVGAADWADSAWLPTALDLTTTAGATTTLAELFLGSTGASNRGRFFLRGDGGNSLGPYLKFNVTSNLPSPGACEPNALYEKNVPKVWLNYSKNAAELYTIRDAFGVSSFASDGGTGMRITFDNAFVNAQYASVTNLSSPATFITQAQSPTTTTVDIQLLDASLNVVTVVAKSLVGEIIIFGTQT